MNRKSLLITALSLLLVAGVGVTVLIHNIPNLVNQQELKESIEKGLHESTGVNFKITELVLKPTLLQGIQVHLNTTTITDMRHRPLGDIGNITVQVRYLPIVFQQLPEIAKIHIRRVNIPIGEASLFKEIKLKLVKPKQTGFLKPAELKDTEILLSNYRIEDEAVSDEVGKLLSALKKPVQRFQVMGKSITIRHVESRKPVEIEGAGVLSFLQTNQVKAIDTAAYRVNLEIPQRAVKTKVLQYHDVSRFNFDLKGKDARFQIRYKRPNNGIGRGHFRSPLFDLMQGQLFVLQLGDTFGFELPKIVTETYVTGLGKMDSHFQLRFPRENKPKKQQAFMVVVPNVQMQGRLQLKNASAAMRTAWPHTIVHHLNGQIVLRGETLSTKDLSFKTGELPIAIRGEAKLNSKQVNVQAEIFNANLGVVRQVLTEGGVPLKPLENRNLVGNLDLIAKVKGKLENPSYFGLLWLKNGGYTDTMQGLVIQGVSGNARFHGQGLQNLQYDGDVVLNHANVQSEPMQLVLQDLKAAVKLKGKLIQGKPPEIPKMEGWFQLGSGQYTHPETGIAVTRIHGKMLMNPTQYQIQNAQANLGSALVNISGTLSPDFKRYQVHVVSHNINIPQLKKELPLKLTGANPQLTNALERLRPTSGTADLDLTISTGTQLKGQLVVNRLNLQTNPPNHPISIPKLDLVFNSRAMVLRPTVLHYGPAEARLEGQFQLDGVYRFSVHTGDIPVEMIRDSVELIRTFSGLALPEIWNTTGSLRIDSILSNQISNLKVSFNQAGLSWQGGDFPVYDLNGHLFYKRVGNGEDFIGTRDLSFYYGNSPIRIKAGSGDHFRLRTEGIFSALLVNHFLVSPQSNATPYREAPFLIRAGGVLEGLPGSKDAERNKIATRIHLDLNPTIKEAYRDQLPTPSHLKPATETPPPVSPSSNNVTVANLPESSRKRRRHHPQNLLSRIQEKVQQGLKRFTADEAETPETEVEVAPSSQQNTVMAKPAAEPVKSETSLPMPQSSERIYSADKPVSRPSSRLSMTAIPEMDPPESTVEDDNAYVDLRLMLAGNDAFLEQARLHLFKAGNLLVSGAVKNMFRPQHRVFGVHLYTDPNISLEKLSHSSRDNDFYRNAAGQFALNVHLDGREKLENIEGWISADKIAIPYLTINEFSGRVDFLGGENAKGEVTAFKVPGVEAIASATTDSLLEFPVTLENVKISGGLLSLDSLEQFSTAIVTPLIIEQLIHNFARPWQQGDPRLPIQFRDADLHFDETILQNIIMSNLNSKFSVYANSFFELTNASLEAAGGKVNGYFSMNPNENNFMTLELNASNVKANALTRALLGVTNQVFGDLSGTVRFTTFGLNDVEMQDNANGTVHMKITNGRLPAIAKVETLLATANLLRGGILGFNLNNLFRSLTFYDTNYFAELSGDLLVANGVLYTDNLISDGVNLDLVIQGSLDMGVGDANMLVNGRMSQDVTGKLGSLGKLSIGSVLRYIPGLGTLGANQPGLLGYLPGVGFVPGFGGPAGDFNHFQVRLVGQLDDPRAIRDFHWVHKTN